MSDQPHTTGRDHPMSTIPATGPMVPAIASATLSQDYNDAISTVVNVADFRRVCVRFKHIGGGSQSGGYPQFIAAGAATQAEPAIGDDDTWFPTPVYDSSPTDADIAGTVTLPTGADFTAGPAWRGIKTGSGLYLGMPADAAEEQFGRFTLDVTDDRWLYIAAVQQGDLVNFGTIIAWWNAAL